MFTFHIRCIDVLCILVKLYEICECSILDMYFCISKTTVRPYLTHFTALSWWELIVFCAFIAHVYFRTYCFTTSMSFDREKGPELYKINSKPKGAALVLARVCTYDQLHFMPFLLISYFLDLMRCCWMHVSDVLNCTMSCTAYCAAETSAETNTLATTIITTIM